MLTISTIPEALGVLEKRTGRAWTESELFDVATKYGIELHAAPPIDAKTTIEKYIDGVGLVETIPRLKREFDYVLAPYVNTNHSARLAVLFPAQVEQLWISGEAFTRHSHLHNEVEDETVVFFEPVRVTREQVRVKAATLHKIIGIWDKAQAGEGRRYKGPEWMFQVELPAPAQSPAKPAPGGPVGDGLSILKSKRPDLLTPLIEAAQRDEIDQFSAAVIWPKLCSKAESKTRPLIGVSPDGIKWTDSNDTIQFLTKNALADRLRRLKNPR